MKQYNQIKAKYPDALLLFRVGDFYETFGADAVRTAKILGIILTKRGAGSTSETELAGFPHHSLNTYLPKLVRAGCRVAICDQLEDPKMTKKIVKRGVTELVTPGVSLNDEGIRAEKKQLPGGNIFWQNQNRGFPFWTSLQAIIGSLREMPFKSNSCCKILLPLKCWWPNRPKKLLQIRWGEQFNVFYLEDWIFESTYALERLTTHFKTLGLKGFGIEKYAGRSDCCRNHIALPLGSASQSNPSHHFYQEDF
jgi:DNA mismatch repair protein MutS